MRAIVCTALTGFDALTVASCADPKPAPGQVVVEIAAAGLNYPDLLMTTGRYQHRPDPPFILGMEAAGMIVACGATVDPALHGRRVMMSARGTFAERVVVDVGSFEIVPEGWSLAEAAAFPVAGKTAFHALVQRARLTRADTLVVHGATGGVGHLAVKLGRALGARVIATTGDPNKADFLRHCGADAIVDSRSPDLADRLKAANDGRGVDVVFDPIGGAVFDASLKAAAFGARLLVIGFVAAEPNAVRTNYALIKGLSVLGVRAGEAARHDPAIAASYRTTLLELARDYDLRPTIDSAYCFAETRAAFDRLKSRGVCGKVILTP